MAPLPLYKYVSAEVARKIIEGKKLKFTQPDNFNDPFDCVIDRLKFDLSDIGEEVENDLLKLKRKFGSSLDEITNEKLASIYLASISDKLKRSSVTCFSLSNDIPLMWAHYADKHQGICIKFTLPLKTDIFNDIPFGKINSGYIDYGDKPPVNYLKDKREGILNLLFTKAAFWRYEQEFRMTSLIGEGFYEFDPSFISGITFGIKYPKDQIDAFKGIVKDEIPQEIQYDYAERNILDLKISKG